VSTSPRSAIILDTNVLSELARPQPDPEVVAELRDVSDRSYVSVITLGELRLGVELLDDGRRRRELLHHVDAVDDAFAGRTIPLSVPVIRNHATGVAGLTRRGIAISVNDAYIAATAVTHGAVLYTRNLKDFHHYPGLVVRSPWRPGG
jgi:toxin FitB